jgi:hypothetical protein
MALEGLATSLLLLPVVLPETFAEEFETLVFAAFCTLLTAALVPALTVLYDAFVVPLIEWRNSGGGLLRLFTTLLIALWAIPG